MNRNFIPFQISRKMWLAGAASFLASLGIYLLTLAPTVTFEDSGELIAAAYNLGVPHQPGYPLFTLLGRMFTMIPLGNMAYRVNLMSAVLSALGAIWICWTVILLIRDLWGEENDGAATLLAGISAALLMAVSFENWEQSIITEVYGLNTFLVSLVILLAVYWRRCQPGQERSRVFFLVCYLLGLAFSNHTTSLMLLPVLAGFVIVEERTFFLSWRRILPGIALMLLGLGCYIYLPLASANNPWMDWGNPENWSNFWRTITRHQYTMGGNQNWAKFTAEFLAYLKLLGQQWPIVFLPFAAAGTYFVYRGSRSYLVLTLLFLFFAAPVTTYLTDFDVTMPDAALVAEHVALVSVFYIPSYIFIAILTALGMFGLLHAAQNYFRMRAGAVQHLAAVMLIPALITFPINYKRLDMSRYYFAEDYVQNVLSVAPEGTIVFTDWDPFAFPFFYVQYVEGKRQDMLMLDQQLLRRSWYIQWLRDHYPAIMEAVRGPVDEFLAAVTPFENRQKYDGNFIEKKYRAMINAIIDYNISQDRQVLFTYIPGPGIAEGYWRESRLVAWRLHPAPTAPQPIDHSRLLFRGYWDDDIPLDRMAKRFRIYYGQLFAARAEQMAAVQNWEEARLLFLRAEQFFTDDWQLRRYIRQAVLLLNQQAKTAGKE